jgi:hypothetical protein
MSPFSCDSQPLAVAERDGVFPDLRSGIARRDRTEKVNPWSGEPSTLVRRSP